MKLEIGMYVRTKSQYGRIAAIAKIDNYKDWDNSHHIDIEDKCMGITEDGIELASYNIIDLIKVGDYVNGSKVVNIYRTNSLVIEQKEIITEPDGTTWDDCIEVNVKDIKSVVTKEQMEAMQYEIN